jgi:hypothetical protein
MMQQSSTSVLVVNSNTPLASNTIPMVSPSSTTIPLANTSIENPISSSNLTDVQAQMMLMLMESFSKLSTVLANKTQDTKAEVKSDWPKFGGDPKKFKPWYLSIVAQISIPPWREFYDQSTNSIVTSTSNMGLSSKLNAKLLVSLEGQALQDMVSRSHLRAKGIQLLQELVRTYKQCKVPEVLVAKAGEFWSKTKRGQTESMDSYYNRFHDLLEDLSEADDKISTTSAMHLFFYTGYRI